MSLLRSAIPKLSSFNEECDVSIEFLQLSSIKYSKFSRKTIESAIKELKQEL